MTSGFLLIDYMTQSLTSIVISWIFIDTILKGLAGIASAVCDPLDRDAHHKIKTIANEIFDERLRKLSDRLEDDSSAEDELIALLRKGTKGSSNVIDLQKIK